MLRRALTEHKKTFLCLKCRTVVFPERFFSQELDTIYTNDQKQIILQVMNKSNDKDLSRYDITKSRIKKVLQWKSTYGNLKTIADIELIDGFADKYAKKLFDSILKGPTTEEKVLVQKISNKIRGQILQPTLSEPVRQNSKLILSVYVSVNSICWTLIERSNYEVVEWNYHGIDYPDGKRLQITDIMQIAWEVARSLPRADIYVMKAEATTLRAGGSDPNNPKVIAVNLQKSQMISMIVALINARSNSLDGSSEDSERSKRENIIKHKVYFLRPTLPYRLFGTLVGNERVSTDQTVELLLQDRDQKSLKANQDTPELYVSDALKVMFRNQNELRRDMLGQCLLLALTFMDLCIYKKEGSIQKLIKRGE